MLSKVRSKAARAHCLGSVLLGLAVFFLCLIGIVSRPHFDLATFWPANAFMLGALVRFPRLAGAGAWLSGATGFLLADAVTGSSLLNNIVLNGGNLAAIAAGYAMFIALPREDRQLQRPASMFLFLRAVLVASVVAGMTGIIANPLLFGGDWAEGFLFWTATEMVNYTAFLPIFLTLPSLRRVDAGRVKSAWQAIEPRKAIPLLALFASIAGATLVGGPGAVAFPVPALLWCALSYSLFATACLSFAFGAWTLVAIRTGILQVGADVDSRSLLISVRMGVTLVALAPLVVASVMAARNELMRQLRLLAERDPMTGLPNRRAFIEAGTAALAESVGKARTAAIMMLDIDNFKSINDRFGHDAGDRVLVAFAQMLERNLRPQDRVGRMGGEEFAVVLPDCSLADAAAVARRINEIARSSPVPLESGETITATVSIGIHLELDEASLEQPLRQADQALYRAKHDGRDRFALSSATQLKSNKLARDGGLSPKA